MQFAYLHLKHPNILSASHKLSLSNFFQRKTTDSKSSWEVCKISEYTKSASRAGHVRRKFQMSDKGVNWAKVFFFARHEMSGKISRCPARTHGSPVKMSSEAQNHFSYSGKMLGFLKCKYADCIFICRCLYYICYNMRNLGYIETNCATHLELYLLNAIFMLLGKGTSKLPCSWLEMFSPLERYKYLQF